MFYFFVWIFLIVEAGIAENHFMAIAYHDVVLTADQVDYDAVTRGDLVGHFQWIKENGYHPIHPDDLLKAQAGEKTLPDKSILLTFDDGYESFYTFVYPLLKTFNFPAVLGVVGSWIDAKEEGKTIIYGSKTISAEKFLTWSQIKEMADSGLVEIASHTFALHKGIVANPQGTTQAALVTRFYNKEQEAYESFDHYKIRIEEDLRMNQERILKKTGKNPRLMVWPYGRYNQVSLDMAKKMGIKVFLTLDGQGYNKDVTHLDAVSRCYYTQEQSLSAFISALKNFQDTQESTLRAVRIDLDHIYDPDPKQTEKNIDALIERLYQYQINTVFLQAFSDINAKGYAESLYFHNSHLPIRSDIFNRICWQIATRVHAKVFAWLPLMAFDFKNDDLLVKSLIPGSDCQCIDREQYIRSSIFHPLARQKILGIYESLAFNAPIDGIAFHDDILTDFEDWSPFAVEAMKKAGFPDSIDTIKNDPVLFSKWSRWKSRSLIDFTKEIIEKVKVFRPTIQTTRSLFADLVLSPESEAWYAQNFHDFLYAYDYVALMAMPYMEKAEDPSAWLDALHEKVKNNPTGLQKTIFELQTVNWRDKNAPIDTKILLEQLRDLSAKGTRHFSLYPDNLFQNHPDISLIKEGISLQSFVHLP